MRGNSSAFLSLAVAMAIVLLAPLNMARAQGRVDPRYIFTEGETARTRLTIDNITKTDEAVSGASWEQRQHQEFIFRVLTTAVDSTGVGTIQMTVESLKASTERSGEARREFDSTKPGQPNSTSSEAQLARLVGQAITMVVEPDGTVRDMRGVDVIARAMTAQLGDNPLAGEIVGGLTGAVADDAMRDALQEGMRVLPGRPVRRGETWTTELTQSLGPLGQAKSNWKHRLASIQRKPTGDDRISQIARIDSEVEISLGDGKDQRKSRRQDSPWAELGLGLKVRLHNATGKATTLFDVTRGRAIKSESFLTMPIEVLVDGLQAKGDKPTMRQQIECAMTHELLPDEPEK